MVSRISFLFVAIFFVTMNVLLWQSEYAAKDAAGSAVPLETVWEKILTAPDNSSLEVLHHGKKIGFCRWAASVGEEMVSSGSGAEEVEGMVRRVSGYKVDFDGNIQVKDFPGRLRFNIMTKFTTNHVWQELSLSVNLKPSSWEIRSSAAEQALHLRVEDENGKSDRVFKFSELQNPQAMLADLKSPLPLAMFSGIFPSNPKSSPMELGVKWEAHNEWFQIGHTSVRAYLVQTKILERYGIKIIVSRVGEILRVELPDGIVLVNDQLTSL